MGETQHTPGPWTVDKHGVITGGPHKCTSIAECYLPPKLRTGTTVEALAVLRMQRANARLLVAAPELLVECQHLLGQADPAFLGPDYRNPDTEDFDIVTLQVTAGWLREVQDTIAKIEGD